MRLEELDYEFPRELIAQQPMEPRDACRLMVVGRSGSVSHRVFSDLPALLSAGDVVVLNDSRVLKARLFTRRDTGGEVELLFLHPLDDTGAWEVLARPSRRLRAGSSLLPMGGGALDLLENVGEGRWAVRSATPQPILELLEAQGLVPLPPYIGGEGVIAETYQTVYAAELGSAAAPTAGLHFTPELLDRLAVAGVNVVFVTLHVGLDTFRPVTEDDPENHAMHTEWCSVSSDVAARLSQAHDEGRSIVAVGTTAVRTLETAAAAAESAGAGNLLAPFTGDTSLFILPGYRFRAVDALLTNFHLPRSTLLLLVSAFAGRERIMSAYEEAVAEGYRFFSFGDCMLII